VERYGGLQRARLCEHILVWQGIRVKFVLSINHQGERAIFLSTDLGLPAAVIVNTYGLRCKIAVSFTSLVQVLFGFCYRFWVKALPTCRRPAKNLSLHRAPEALRLQVAPKGEAYGRSPRSH
jgi:hypothetical protein